jgi:hypothetical protein
MKKFLFAILAVLAVGAAFATGVDLNHITSAGISLMGIPAVIDTEHSRVVSDRINALFGDLNFLVQPAYIRSENVISNTKNSYSFETRSDRLANITGRPLQKGVDNNDLFFVSDWGLYLDNRVTTSKSQVVLQTFPNSIAFAAATTGCTYAQLDIFYNSSIQFQVGSTVWYEAYDTQRFRYVPQTQQTAATTAAAGNYSQASLKDTLVPIAPYAVLSGSASNIIQLNIPALPDTADMAVDTGTQPTGENVLTLYFNGFVIKNGADNPVIAKRLLDNKINLK